MTVAETEEIGAANTMAARLARVDADGPDASDARHRVRARLFGEDSPARPRRTVGRFVLLERLGAGAMGEVFAAHDPELDRKVAVKLVHRDRGDSEAARARLLREAQAMARLSHPNVVTVYESGTHEDRVYIAMELIAGVDLRAAFRRERPWRRVVEVYRDAARGLAAAHAGGLVHRDFKPENVMIGEDGRVRVLDFGVARASEEPAGASASVVATLHVTVDGSPTTGPSRDLLARSMTRSGVLLGTPAYMAPEQFKTGETSPRSDQFSFCVALYEGLYGQRPFVAETLAELLAAHARETRPPAGGEVPRAVQAVVLRGLRRDPAARFASMDALHLALERCLGGRGRLLRRLTLGGLTGAALVAGYLVAGRPAAVDPCLAGEAAIAAVWSPERAAALAQEFARSGAADAPATWDRISARVDEYAAAWARGHADACEAARLSGESARRLPELRMACLGDARRELDETLKLLASGEPAVVYSGVQAVAGLPDLRRCAASEALLAALPPPADPQVAASVASLRARAAEVRALRRAGLPERAHAEATRLVADAAQVDHPPLAAELDLLLGQTELDTARLEPARQTLERGFWTAVDSRHDEVAATAAVALAGLVGGRQAALEAGLGWARVAEAAIRGGGLPAAQIVALRRNKARMLRVAGQPDRAREELDAALAVRRGAPGLDPLDEVWLQRDLGGVALEQGRADEAATLLAGALERGRAALGERHPEVGRTLRLLGTSLYTAGRRDEALQAFARALDIAERTQGREHPDVADALNNLGATLDELGRDSEALPAYQRALEIRRARLGEDHPDVAAVLDNLSFTLIKLGRLDEAEATLRRTQAIFRAIHGERHPAIATNYLGLANLARTRGDHVAAAGHASAAVAMYTAIHGPDHPDVAYALASLAEIQLTAGDAAAAIEPARRALELRSGAATDPLLLAEARLRLGQALWLARRDRTAGRELLRAARAGYAAHAPAETLAGIDAWLAAQRIAMDP